MTAEVDSKATTKRRKRPGLTEEETNFQKSRGLYYRGLVRESTKDMLVGADKDKVGILLSGGVDSTTVLWQLLELGIRPYVYTIHFPGKIGTSQDAAKAKHLAEKYRLPFRLVDMTADPDKLVQDIKDISYEYVTNVITRADHEVLAMFQQMFRAAQDDGVGLVFSGIGDENIHLVGRKQEIRARNGLMPLSECNYRRMFSFGSKQVLTLVQMAAKMGINFGLPLTIVASMYPYHDVDWNVMNTPRLKEITIGAWNVEETTSGITAIVRPMQCGDSGAREYFDDSIKASELAASLMGRTPTSAIVLYNWLKKTRPDDGVVPDEESSGLEWFSHVTGGTPIPSDYIKPINPDGTAKTPDKFGIDLSEVEEDIFSDMFDDEGDEEAEYTRLPDGTFDERIDCMGAAFWDPYSQSGCERAQAGLCSRYQGSVHPYHLEKCTVWKSLSDWNAYHLETIAQSSGSQIAKAYSKWSDISEENAAKISEGTCNFTI